MLFFQRKNVIDIYEVRSKSSETFCCERTEHGRVVHVQQKRAGTFVSQYAT